MLQKTRGIVLRAVKYGETSLVVTIFTEEWGVQSYLVSGVRSSSAKASSRPGMRAASFQPGNLLDMVAYYHTRKSLQRLSEVQFAYLYQHMPADPVRTAVMLYMVELLWRVLQHPQPFKELFAFAVEQLQWLDTTTLGIGNEPLYFTLHAAALLGVGLPDDFDDARPYLDLREGQFVSAIPAHPDYLDAADSAVTARLLACRSPDEASTIPLSQVRRRKLILHYQDYLRWHVPGFTALHALPTLFQLFDLPET